MTPPTTLLRGIALLALVTAAGSVANASNFSPKFSDYAFPGTQFDVDAPANAFFALNYGITVNNAYLYRDSRDLFDGIGVANGNVSEIGTPQAGRIDFLDLTDFVTIDFLAVQPTTYSAFSSGDVLLASFVGPGGDNGTFTLDGGAENIAYVTFATTGGFGAVSGLTYNYDGTTGGGNTDLPGASPVPEAKTNALMLVVLGLAGTVARRRNKA